MSPKLQQTSNSRLLPSYRWPSNSSTNHSWSSDALKSYGSGCTLFGNNASLEALYGLNNNMWKTGFTCWFWSAVGNSNLYVDISGHAFITFHRPTNFGQSFLARPFGRFRFLVERNTSNPSHIFRSSVQCLFVQFVWKTHASIMAPWASARCCKAFSVNA